MRSLRWALATAAGFVLGGVALHSPGASGIGTSYLDWDMSAAAFGAVLGGIVGMITGVLQMLALGVRSWRLIIASVVAVAVAHALADGAPAIWSVPVVAAISGVCAAFALARALHVRTWRWIVVSAIAWWAGWMLGVVVAAWFGLSGGSTQGAWAMEHAVIAAILGLAWGAATSPDARRAIEESHFMARLVRAQRHEG